MENLRITLEATEALKKLGPKLQQRLGDEE